MRVIRSLATAFSMYSRIPVPRVEWSDGNRRYAMCFFPLIGAVIGGALRLWLWLCEQLGCGSLLRGAFAAILPVLITGGIHMDGFMDTMDALGSCQPRERKLEILKDSRVGAFAAMALCAYLLLCAALYGEMPLKSAPALMPCFVLSRALSAGAAVTLRGARADGMLQGFAKAAQSSIVLCTCFAYAAACLLGWVLFGGARTAGLCLAAALCVSLYYVRMAYKQFGGVTGDLAGWYLQVMELALIGAVYLGGKIG